MNCDSESRTRADLVFCRLRIRPAFAILAHACGLSELAMILSRRGGRLHGLNSSYSDRLRCIWFGGGSQNRAVLRTTAKPKWQAGRNQNFNRASIANVSCAALWPFPKAEVPAKSPRISGRRLIHGSGWK